MPNDFSINLKKSVFDKLEKIKKEMGCENVDWNNWFDDLFETHSNDESVKLTLEKIFEKSAYEEYYEDWVRNFALNLEEIWNGASATELSPTKTSKSKPVPAIIIGRGPSIDKHDHLKLLSKSKFSGNIICSDGALKKVLDSGVTPDKFKNFFVLTIDTQKDAANFYNGPIVKKYGKGIRCLLSTTVPKITVQSVRNAGMKIYWLHTLFDYNKGKTSFNFISGIITKRNSKRGLPGIQTGGNVGTSAWVASWSILKSNPVALIGLDLSYPAETSWDEINNYHTIPDNLDIQSELFKKAYPTVFNPDLKCYSKQDPKFQFYCNALKEFIPRASKFVHTINATEGGALFGDGIECMKFQDFLDKF